MDFDFITAGVGGTGEGVVLYVGTASGTVTGRGIISDKEIV